MADGSASTLSIAEAGSSSPDQLTLDGPSCPYCGPLAHHKHGGTYLHKCACPHREDAFCQAHKPPVGCDSFTDLRHPKHATQLTHLPGESWADIFICRVDESAGLSEDAA